MCPQGEHIPDQSASAVPSHWPKSQRLPISHVAFFTWPCRGYHGNRFKSPSCLGLILHYINQRSSHCSEQKVSETGFSMSGTKCTHVQQKSNSASGLATLKALRALIWALSMAFISLPSLLASELSFIFKGLSPLNRNFTVFLSPKVSTVHIPNICRNRRAQPSTFLWSRLMSTIYAVYASACV